MSVSSGLIATKIIGPIKFRTRKETVDIDILVISRNGDRKIAQSIRITSRPRLRKRSWASSEEHLPIEKAY